jgi:hypothetical protein
VDGMEGLVLFVREEFIEAFAQSDFEQLISVDFVFDQQQHLDGSIENAPVRRFSFLVKSC